MDATFWNGRRVFVTGHTGFKGSWLCLWLSELQAVVAGYALDPPTSPSLFEVANIKDVVHDFRGNINNLSLLSAEMQRFKPEIVFHLAAQPLVRYSYENPIETLNTNIIGTGNLLEAVRSSPSVRAVIVISTDKCYENKEWTWGYRETDPLGGYDPYSASKAAAELITACYRSSFFNRDCFKAHGVAIATARAGNVLGGGDWALDRLVPDLLRSIAVGEPLILRNPKSIRPWQHVLEPLNGYLLLAQKLIQAGPEYGDSWNFGPDDLNTISVVELVEKLMVELGSSGNLELDHATHPHEANLLRLDTSKARAKLGWRPILSIDRTISWLAKWARGYQSGQNMRALTVQQIVEYESLLGEHCK